mgnify:CR=1 FL=1
MPLNQLVVGSTPAFDVDHVDQDMKQRSLVCSNNPPPLPFGQEKPILVSISIWSPVLNRKVRRPGVRF